MNQIILTILITENMFLFFLLIIWLNRYCPKCQQVKCIERIFNKLCSKCRALLESKCQTNFPTKTPKETIDL